MHALGPIELRKTVTSVTRASIMHPPIVMIVVRDEYCVVQAPSLTVAMTLW